MVEEGNGKEGEDEEIGMEGEETGEGKGKGTVRECRKGIGREGRR